MFRFEEVWIEEEGCNNIIEQAWQSGYIGDTIKDVMDVIKICNKKLSQWNRQSFGNVQR